NILALAGPPYEQHAVHDRIADLTTSFFFLALLGITHVLQQLTPRHIGRGFAFSPGLIRHGASAGAPQRVAAAARCGAARSGISLAAANSILSSPLQRNDLGMRSRLGGAERRPLLHQPAPLLGHVPALVGLLPLFAPHVCQ